MLQLQWILVICSYQLENVESSSSFSSLLTISILWPFTWLTLHLSIFLLTYHVIVWVSSSPSLLFTLKLDHVDKRQYNSLLYKFLFSSLNSTTFHFSYPYQKPSSQMEVHYNLQCNHCWVEGWCTVTNDSVTGK